MQKDLKEMWCLIVRATVTRCYTHRCICIQRRNFGLKSGEPIQEGRTRLPWVQRRDVSSRCGPGQSPDRKRFWCNLISADRLWWQQLFLPVSWKVGVRYPSPKSGLVPRKLRKCMYPFVAGWLCEELWEWFTMWQQLVSPWHSAAGQVRHWR